MRPGARAVVVSAVGCAVAAVMLVAMLPGGPGPRLTGPDRPVVALYDAPATRLEAMLNRGDGQAFAALAVDPALRRPDVFRQGRAVAAYRAQRPLLGWLAAITSGGRAGQVPLAMAVWTIAGAGLVMWAAARLLADRGRHPAVALFVLALPGVIVTLSWTGPELVATGLALTGLVLLRPGRAAAPALACFALAGLGRETLLLVPLALAAGEATVWWRGRGSEHHSGARRRLVALAATGLPWAMWVGVVRWRFGSWPTGIHGNLGLPLAGFIAGALRWGPGDAYVAALVMALTAAALSSRHATVRRIAVAHVVLAALLGPLVWETATGFGRVLLPVCVLGTVEVAERLAQAGRIQLRRNSSRRSAHSSEVMA